MGRVSLQASLEQIAIAIDPGARVEYVFDAAAFLVRAPGRRDVPLAESFVADRSDGQVRDATRLGWGL